MKKEYLGDGVYMEFDGEALVLTTSNGIGITNRVFVDKEYIPNLLDYIQRMSQV